MPQRLARSQGPLEASYFRRRSILWYRWHIQSAKRLGRTTPLTYAIYRFPYLIVRAFPLYLM
ncbi:hypothetical protein BC827DRAFT_1226618 [Russula dissimulans]|nr:hypothetical protein BC827DRAFT_1226618 [Russula dissimulans]